MDNLQSARASISTRFTIPHYYFILFFAIPVCSCKDSVQLFQPIPEPTEFRNAVLPLAIGNSWKYVDSSNSFGYPLRTDTVTRFRVDHGTVWWTINYQMAECADKDGVAMFLPYRGQAYTRFIPTPASGDTVLLDWQLPTGSQVRAYASVKTMTVPAGTFDSCTVYEYEGYWGHTWYYFKPGIGMIYYETTTNSTPGYVGKTYLVAYSLVK
jgi:hypothetical protein